MPETLRPMVPSFEDPDALQAGLLAKSLFQSTDLYPRDGCELLGETEDRLKELSRSDGGNALAYVSGMSAVTAAIDAALHFTRTEGALPVLACSEQAYSQTRRYIENFVRNKRASVIYFDSGTPSEVSRVYRDKQPDVVVSETVANYMDTPVLDVEHLLYETRASEISPFLVLDNTLPLSTGIPLGEKLTEEDDIVVVESGTKSYTKNTVMLGISITKNQTLHDFLRRYRRTRGDIPDRRHLETVLDVLPETLDEFDERNLKLYRNTGETALALAEGLGDNKDFIVSHPALPSHENHGRNAVSPVLYIQTPKLDQFEAVRQLWRHPYVSSNAELGQSFGFDRARIVHDEYVRAVRIAGGAGTDGKELGISIAEALTAE